MDKQSSLYFLILIAVVGVSGYMFNNKLQADTAQDVFANVQGVSTPNSATATTPGAEAETKDAIDPIKLPETKPKKYMNDSDVTKLDVQVTKEGTGPESKKGDTLSMNYTGKLLNGTTFDSNVDPKFNHVQPFAFQLGAGMVIRGWDEGLVGMKVGEKRILTIPSDMGYGARGAGGAIPPNAALVFEVELLKIN